MLFTQTHCSPRNSPSKAPTLGTRAQAVRARRSARCSKTEEAKGLCSKSTCGHLGVAVQEPEKNNTNKLGIAIGNIKSKST